MKKRIYKTLGILGILWGIFSMAYGVRMGNRKYSERFTFCGNVDKVLPVTMSSGKYPTSEFYLIIKFDVGVRQAIEVNRLSYYDAKPNQRVCFKVRKMDLYGTDGTTDQTVILWIIGGILWVVISAICLQEQD